MARTKKRKQEVDDDIEFLERVVSIDVTQITEHFISVPAELAYFNERYAETVRGQLEAKSACDNARATAYCTIKTEYEEEGKKITEAALSAQIELDPAYTEAKIAFVDAETKKQQARGRVEAVHAKKDMLISLGAHLRAELSDPMVKRIAQNAKETNDTGFDSLTNQVTEIRENKKRGKRRNEKTTK